MPIITIERLQVMKIAKVEGQLTLKDGKQVDLDYYECEVLVPDEVDTTDKAQFFIVRGGLTREAMKKTPNFKSIRTQTVVSLEDAKGDDDREPTLIETLLMQAAALSCVPESLDAYKTDKSKIKALQDAIERAEARKAKLKAKGKGQELLSGYID